MYNTSFGLLLFVISTLVVAVEGKDLSLSESLTFTEIKAQCYMKGQLNSEKDWLIAETSESYYLQKFANESYHKTCVDSFKIAKHEVTVELYQQYAADNTDVTVGDTGCYVVGENGWENNSKANWKNPTFQQEKNHPVVCISYYETQKFIGWLNKKLKPNFPYRLPTEAEWELAARGTEKQRDLWRYWGNDIEGTQACKYGNVSDLSLNEYKKQDSTFDCKDGTIHTSNVHSYEPNDYDLYHMLGNAQEYTCSGFGENPLEMEGTCETQEKAENITVKGASWYYPPIFNRSAFRGGLPRHLRFYGVGFRLVQHVE
jgi:formylglycine-generating enzyme required for sulfatase activity